MDIINQKKLMNKVNRLHFPKSIL